MSDIEILMREEAQIVHANLDKVLTGSISSGEVFRPQRLICAMRHGALNGGKRFRPLLVLQCGQVFGADRDNLIQIATAIECIHCYSLVHDDLPAMDDDDLRRGKPTVHKAYDEATAILAGDGLLTLAFDLLSNVKAHKDPNVRLRLVSGLAKASGVGGMVGGQVLDIFPESEIPNLNAIARMQAMKTGALIRFSCEAGAIAAGVNGNYIKRISKFGELIGQAFQLTDDVLDVVSNIQILGKQTTKDAARGKVTEVTTLGVENAQSMAAKLIDDACEQLEGFGAKAHSLRQIAGFVLERKR